MSKARRKRGPSGSGPRRAAMGSGRWWMRRCR